MINADFEIIADVTCLVQEKGFPWLKIRRYMEQVI